MMDISGIASASVVKSAADVQSPVSVAVAAKNLDTIEEMGDGLKKMMEMSVQPNVGSKFDVSV